MIDLKAELIRSVMNRLQSETNEVRLIAEDLNVKHADQVILTRLEAHAVKLEVYYDMLSDVVKERKS
jgi:hypothetical protein